MGVSNGQIANEDTFNNAFPSKNANDTIPSKWDLTNTDAESGDSVINLQKTVNEASTKNYSVQVIAAGGEINIDNAKGTQNRRIQSNSGVESLSITPFGNTGGWADGTEVRLFGESDANRPTITFNDIDYGCILNGDANLRRFDCITLVWFEDLLRWVEQSRNF